MGASTRALGVLGALLFGAASAGCGPGNAQANSDASGDDGGGARDAADPPASDAAPASDVAPGADAAAVADASGSELRDAGGSPASDTGAAPTAPDAGAPGNPRARCDVPAEARAAPSTNPRTVVGDGTAASCTSEAFVNAVARGGVITFACGPAPVTITVERTAKVFNDTGPEIVIDGGGLVTLSGGGRRRILYMNTCDMAQRWTTPRCQNQDHPRLTLQNLTFVDGNATGETAEGGGGGAVFVRGGRVRFVNTRFFRNRCDETGPDVGGGAVRVLSQHEGRPVYVVDSVFGGPDGQGNRCSNGAALSSIGVSYTVLNSTFTHNLAVGRGANPMRAGTPGGGSGGAIYNDGNTFTLTLCGSVLERNEANEGGGAVFFVSNDRTGTMLIDRSRLSMNPSRGFETRGFPGLFVLAREAPTVRDSVLE